MTKLIDTREIAAFAQVGLPKWMEVPGWVRFIAVDGGGDIKGFSRLPRPNPHGVFPGWLRSHAEYTCRHLPLRLHHIHSTHPGRRLLPDWDQWYWEVPA